MTDAPGLLPCPFCSGEAGFGDGQGYVFVNCCDCLASTNNLIRDFAPTTLNDAADAWNTRADIARKVKPLVWETGPRGEEFADDGFGGNWIIDHRDGRSAAQHTIAGHVADTMRMNIPIDAMKSFVEELRAARILAALE